MMLNKEVWLIDMPVRGFYSKVHITYPPPQKNIGRSKVKIIEIDLLLF